MNTVALWLWAASMAAVQSGGSQTLPAVGVLPFSQEVSPETLQRFHSKLLPFWLSHFEEETVLKTLRHQFRVHGLPETSVLRMQQDGQALVFAELKKADFPADRNAEPAYLKKLNHAAASKPIKAILFGHLRENRLNGHIQIVFRLFDRNAYKQHQGSPGDFAIASKTITLIPQMSLAHVFSTVETGLSAFLGEHFWLLSPPAKAKPARENPLAANVVQADKDKPVQPPITATDPKITKRPVPVPPKPKKDNNFFDSLAGDEYRAKAPVSINEPSPTHSLKRPKPGVKKVRARPPVNVKKPARKVGFRFDDSLPRLADVYQHIRNEGFYCHINPSAKHRTIAGNRPKRLVNSKSPRRLLVKLRQIKQQKIIVATSRSLEPGQQIISRHWYPKIMHGTFEDAENWVAKMNQSQYGGYSDWRIPTISEMFSLITIKANKVNDLNLSAEFAFGVRQKTRTRLTFFTRSVMVQQGNLFSQGCSGTIKGKPAPYLYSIQLQQKRGIEPAYVFFNVLCPSGTAYYIPVRG